jgi:hypothetical protein
MAHRSTEEWVEGFPWESEDQKKGFLALYQHLRGYEWTAEDEISKLEEALSVVSAWFIQRDHESNEWWNERVGDLSGRVDQELMRLTRENEQMKSDIEELKAALIKTR